MKCREKRSFQKALPAVKMNLERQSKETVKWLGSGQGSGDLQTPRHTRNFYDAIVASDSNSSILYHFILNLPISILVWNLSLPGWLDNSA